MLCGCPLSSKNFPEKVKEISMTALPKNQVEEEGEGAAIPVEEVSGAGIEPASAAPGRGGLPPRARSI